MTTFTPAPAATENALASFMNNQEAFDVTTLPRSVKRRLNALKNLELKYNVIRRDFLREVAELETKYHVKYQPLYDERAAIASGDKEPSDQEVTLPSNVEDLMADEDGDKETEEKDNVKGIPDFWLTVLQNFPSTCELMAENDVEALKSLRDIRVQYLKDNPGFSLEFEFAENAFFNNKVLVKTYYVTEPQDDLELEDEYLFDRAEATPIEWKEGKDLTVKVEVKKQRHKETSKTRVVKRTVPAKSFFNFFKSQKLPSEQEAEQMEEHHLDELENLLEMDYSIGEELKEKVVPYALQIFLGQVGDDEDFSDEGMSEMEFNEDDDDE